MSALARRVAMVDETSPPAAAGVDGARALADLARDGVHIVTDVLDAGLRAALINDLEAAYRRCRAVQEKNGLAADTTGTVHHLLGQGDSFLELLALMTARFDDVFQRFFDSEYVLNAMGGNLNRNAAVSYASRVHRDVRTYTRDVPLMLNTIVALDDYTPDNGATLLLAGSHQRAQKPSDDTFFAQARPALCPAGAVVLFDSRVWHAAGVNHGGRERRIITPMFTKPFVKPQFDYIAALGGDQAVGRLPQRLQQVLGLFARVPASLDQWYQPREHRFYRANQEIPYAQL